MALRLVAADPDAWMGGGGYDGYDAQADRGAIGYPQINNARGATGITASNAVLNGVLVATGGAPATVTVFWGTSDGGTEAAGWGHTNELGGGVAGQSFAWPVIVEPGLTYYYRFFASNLAAEVGWAGATARFTAPASPWVTIGVGAAPVSYSTAGLNGELMAGLSADLTVLWGADSNAWANTNGLGTRFEGPFTVQVAGLLPGMVYYYQCLAVNLYGSNRSEVSTFTTLQPGVWFDGGSFDGYAQIEGDILMQLRPGSALMVVY